MTYSLLPARTARANGAFPDSLQIILPAGEPDRIIFATNFGLVLSSDGGKTWQWTCEHDDSLGASRYQQSAASGKSLLAVALGGVVRSHDEGCTWQSATGRVSTGFVYDVFADPTDDLHVFAIADPNDETPTRTHVFESRDGAATFPVTLLDAAPLVDLRSVESARSEPGTIYVTYSTSGASGLQSGLFVLHDGGKTAEMFDLTAALGGDPLFLAVVSRADPRKLFLRVTSAAKDAIALSDDGGKTARIAVEVTDVLTGFVEREDGALFAAGTERGSGVLFSSYDGGLTFTRKTATPHFRGLAARGRRLFAAGDLSRDTFALATSDDDGQTWTPVLRLTDVAGTRTCNGTSTLALVCAAACSQVASRALFRPEICAPIVSARDASQPDLAGPSGGPDSTPGAGCGCRLGDGTPQETLVFASVWVVLLLARRKKPRCRPPGERDTRSTAP